MEFANKLRPPDELACTVGDDVPPPDDDSDTREKKKRKKSTGRRDLTKLPLEEDRIELPDPVYEKLVAQGDHGLRNSISDDRCSVAYWYQCEPHRPRPSLPAVADRQPTLPWTNIVQWVLCATAVCSFVAIAFLSLRAWGR